MRGADNYNESLFTSVKLEDFVPASHPQRPIRVWVNDALAKMDARFSAMNEADVKGGRPSIAPEKLMRAMLLQVLYSVRSERQLVEQIQYNLLFRRFVGLAIEDTVWNHSVFSKNRDRLIEHEAVTELFKGADALSRATRPTVVSTIAGKALGHVWARRGPQMGHKAKRRSFDRRPLCAYSYCFPEKTGCGGKI